MMILAEDNYQTRMMIILADKIFTIQLEIYDPKLTSEAINQSYEQIKGKTAPNNYMPLP